MLVGRSILGTAKAMFAGALPTLLGTGAHQEAPADSAYLTPQIQEIPAPIDAHPMSAAVSRGLAIRRSLTTKDAAKWFVSEMQSRELTGERTWRAIWEFYQWLCDEEDLVPLLEGMKARFAHELSKLCERGQVRIREGGRLRRLTTYVVPNVEPAYLRTAA